MTELLVGAADVVCQTSQPARLRSLQDHRKKERNMKKQNAVKWIFHAAFALFLALSGVRISAAPLSFSLDIGQIQHPDFSLVGLKLNVRGEKGTLYLEKLDVAGQSWQQARIECGRLSLASGAFLCGQGQLHVANRPPLALEIRQQKTQWLVRFNHTAHEFTQVVYEGENQNLRLEFSGTHIKDWASVLPQLANWHPSGQLHGKVEYGSGRFSTALNLQDGAYFSEDGTQAAEKMTVTLALSGEENRGKWKLKGHLNWSAGDLYYAPALLSGSGQTLEFEGEADATGWALPAAQFTFPKIGQIHASGRGLWAGMDAMDLTVSAKAIALQPLGETLIAPLLANQGALGVNLTGMLDLNAELKNGQVAAASFALENAGFVMEGNRFALEGMTGGLEWNQNRKTDNTLAVKKMAIGRLESGAFNTSLAIWPEKSFALTSPITIPILDGELILRHFAAGMTRDGSGEWEGALGISITPMALEKLTERLDLPIMAGAISADLPVIRYVNREASLDGALVIQVFEGYLRCNELRLVDPLGVRPRIQADVEARHINLEQLTNTFSFGRITGFVDADLKGLEIAGWRPLAFNARIASSPGSYPRRISQRAVDNITALGGGGAMAAVQSSVLRMFSDFGYRQIGLSCRLANGVCHMQGVPGTDRGTQYIIVQGGGIPALNIMGYNRQIDWDEFITRLKAATQSSGPTVQ
ncbi:MAG: hypothetical protein LBQ75_02535 [Zoogloeaceae bacterium]|jgi:hypothetical protein|nr:hypothetical protein [Zoogloeaceae bacterium]